MARSILIYIWADLKLTRRKMELLGQRSSPKGEILWPIYMLCFFFSCLFLAECYSNKKAIGLFERVQETARVGHRKKQNWGAHEQSSVGNQCRNKWLCHKLFSSPISTKKLLCFFLPAVRSSASHGVSSGSFLFLPWKAVFNSYQLINFLELSVGSFFIKYNLC